jgi:hypothetical protein
MRQITFSDPVELACNYLNNMHSGKPRPRTDCGPLLATGEVGRRPIQMETTMKFPYSEPLTGPCRIMSEGHSGNENRRTARRTTSANTLPIRDWAVLAKGIRDNNDASVKQFYDVFNAGFRLLIKRQLGESDLAARGATRTFGLA